MGVFRFPKRNSTKDLPERLDALRSLTVHVNQIITIQYDKNFSEVVLYGR